MPSEPLKLSDGCEITAVQFQANRSDVTYFVAAGNIVFLTINGRRRVSLAPPEVGEQYLRNKQARTSPPLAGEASTETTTAQPAAPGAPDAPAAPDSR